MCRHLWRMILDTETCSHQRTDGTPKEIRCIFFVMFIFVLVIHVRWKLRNDRSRDGHQIVSICWSYRWSWIIRQSREVRNHDAMPFLKYKTWQNLSCRSYHRKVLSSRRTSEESVDQLTLHKRQDVNPSDRAVLESLSWSYPRGHYASQSIEDNVRHSIQLLIRISTSDVSINSAG